MIAEIALDFQRKPHSFRHATDLPEEPGSALVLQFELNYEIQI